MANSLLNPTTTLPTVPITLTAQTDGDFPAPTSIGNSPLIPMGVDSGDFTAQSAISLLHPTRVDSGDFTAPSSDDDFAAQTAVEVEFFVLNVDESDEREEIGSAARLWTELGTIDAINCMIHLVDLSFELSLAKKYVLYTPFKVG
ncbi:hypothetical protein OROGR_010772 [Orobanche gracilis]